jgi:PST family polysaccharide transporter
MSLLQTAVHGGLWTAGIRYGFFFVNFLANLWLARLLTPEHFGTFALALSAVELLFILASFGIALACINLHDEAEVFDTAMTLSVGLAMAIFGLSLGAAAIAGQVWGPEIAQFVLVLSAMKSLFLLTTVPLAYLEVQHRFKTAAFITGLGRPMGILVAVALAHAGLGATSLLVREVLAIGLTAVLAVGLSPYRMRLGWDPDLARRIWAFSCGIFFMRMTDTLYHRLPNLVLGGLAGTNVLGLFERSLYLSTMTNTILAQVYGKVGFAIFSKVKDQPEKIAYGLIWNIFFASRVSFLVALVVLLFPQTLLVSALGSQWGSATEIFRGFAAMIAMLPVLAAIKHGLMAVGGTALVTWSRLAAIAVTLAGLGLGWALERWEMVSWAMSTGAVLSVVMLVLSARRYRLQLSLALPLALPLALSLGLGGAAVALGLSETGVGLVGVLSVWIGVVVIVDYGRMRDFYRLVRPKGAT